MKLNLIILIILSGCAFVALILCLVSGKRNSDRFYAYCKEVGGDPIFHWGEYYCKKDGVITYHGNIDKGFTREGKIYHKLPSKWD